MSPPSPREVREIFTAVLEVDPARREAFIADRCGADASLAQEVRALLNALQHADGYLDNPTAPTSARAVASPAVLQDPSESLEPSLVGTSVGPFRLMELLGEGGFGLVYLGEQREPLRRRVAVKLIKAGMDSKEVLARFEAERQALAMMDHPNIARVLDAGTTTAGRPYFVMELVRGVPLTRYCDEACLTPRERLELLIPVCQAVQHAHAKGVIHRDLKPSNVLVTVQNGEAVPKVIDFGIAKAVSGRLTDATIYTQFRQMIGTPAYMSPEQAGLGDLDVDSRSDVYSLGVLMYELLTGTTPLTKEQLIAGGLAEVQRIIREVDPPRPSTRISASGERLVTIATQRRTEPSRLGRLMRGELDWIVMRAMDKDRRRRYQTAEAMAADLQRHLIGDAVLARPTTALYRIRKLVARRRAAFAAVTAVIIALLVGAVAAGIGFYNATRERDRAVRADQEKQALLIEARQAKTAADEAATEANAARQAQAAEAERSRREAERAFSLLAFNDHVLGLADPNITRDGRTTARQMLDAAASKVDEYFSQQPAEELAMRSRIGRAYAALGDYPSARFHLARAEQLLDAGRATLKDRFDVEFFLGLVLLMQRDPLLSNKFVDAWIISRQRIEAGDPELGKSFDELKESFGHGGLRYRPVESDAVFNRTLAVARARLKPDNPLREPAWLLLFERACSIADNRLLVGRTLQFDAAITMIKAVEEFAVETWPETHTHVFLTRYMLFDHFLRAGRNEEAAALAEQWRQATSRLLPPGHWLPEYIGCLHAIVLLNAGRVDDAEPFLTRARASIFEQCGIESIPGRACLTGLVRIAEARNEEAAQSDELRDQLARAAGSTWFTPTLDEFLRLFRSDQGTLREAVKAMDKEWGGGDEPALFQRLQEARLQCGLAGTPRDRALARWLQYSAWQWSHAGRGSAADRLRLFEFAEEIQRPYADRDSSAYGWTLTWVARVRRAVGDLRGSEEAARRSVDIWEMNRGAAGTYLAYALLAQGRAEEAIAAARTATAWSRHYVGIDHGDTADATEVWFQAAARVGREAEPRDSVLELLRADEQDIGVSVAGFASRAWFIARSPGAEPADYELALRVARRAVAASEPDNSWRQKVLAMCLLRAGEYAEAADTVQKALDTDKAKGQGELPIGCTILALARKRLGDEAAAASALEKARQAIASKPELANLWVDRLMQEAE